MKRRGSFHRSVREYKRNLILTAIVAANGNRTHAAKLLGLQRTYLLRLIRVLEVKAPRRAA